MTNQYEPLVVLDTSAFSIITYEREHADFYRSHLEGRRAVLPFQSREESLFGAFDRNWGQKRLNELRIHLDQYEMIGVTGELVEISATLRRECKASGHPLSKADAWIAATALQLRCPLISDDGDFQWIEGLELIRYSLDTGYEPTFPEFSTP